MKRKHILLIAAVITILVLMVAGLLWRTNPNMQSGQIGHESSRSQTSQATTAPQDKAQATEQAYEKIGNMPINMSDQEFHHLRVRLPAPINKPWKGLLYNSENCFDKNLKLTVVTILPGWIRKAILAGETDIAARYLWSFLQFTHDPDKEVSTKAIISLYRMGDYNGIALNKMKQWIETGFNYDYMDAEYGASDLKDIRNQILEETEYYHDPSLLDTVKKAWARNQNNEGEDLASVDYAYYLEKQGTALPPEYWLNRLKTPYAFDHALEVLENRKPEGLTDALEPLFEQLESKPVSSSDAGRAAEMAAALFQLTGSPGYRDYLVNQAQAQLASGEVTSSLPKTLGALAATNDDSAIGVLSATIKSSNPVIRETAIDALGNSQNPKAADILYESAAQEAKTRFPNRQLHALLEQNNPVSDSKYQQLEQALLTGQLGWHATSSDFAALEAVRQYGRSN